MAKKVAKKVEESKDEGYIPQELGDFNPKVVQERDPKTGQVIRINPFKVIIDNGVRFYEWPKGSKNLWWENRSFAGRLNDKGKPVRDLPHQPYNPPKTLDQSIAHQNASLQNENRRLALEIEEMKRERELSVSHPVANINKPDTDEAKESKLAKS